MSKDCMVPWCDRKSYAKGYCEKHYMQVRMHGEYHRSRFDPKMHKILENENAINLDIKECLGIFSMENGSRKLNVPNSIIGLGLMLVYWPQRRTTRQLLSFMVSLQD